MEETLQCLKNMFYSSELYVFVELVFVSNLVGGSRKTAGRGPSSGTVPIRFGLVCCVGHASVLPVDV